MKDIKAFGSTLNLDFNLHFLDGKLQNTKTKCSATGCKILSTIKHAE